MLVLHAQWWPIVETPAAIRAVSRRRVPVTHARGSFDVTVTPVAGGESHGVGRMKVEKTFTGELQGRSQFEMLTGMTAVKGSAAYVAIERIEGQLAGRKGSFLLQHAGTMNRGAQSLSITVVPDSGTGELAGLAGSMAIDIAANGAHSYHMEYTLP
jgi:hypothetical protein